MDEFKQLLFGYETSVHMYIYICIYIYIYIYIVYVYRVYIYIYIHTSIKYLVITSIKYLYKQDNMGTPPHHILDENGRRH